ncbi:methyltransferas-like protein [Glonium stellatum]|uniref:carnosine N-methyltransferase n=1 Tax=Glonium stellatum TaxID=574774 RepID=A0A8E2EYU4_9PEZI|nr:methyltransferas-like protein [Glonium stellatum]
MAEGGEWHGDYDPLADPEEQKHLLSVLDSFRSYRRAAHYNATHTRRQAFYSLPSEHWNLLASPPFSVLDSLSQLDDLIDQNADLAEAIFKVGFRSFVTPMLDPAILSTLHATKNDDQLQIYSTVIDKLGIKAAPTDLDKARSCINQFYRDWSAEGASERAAVLSPVLSALAAEFPAANRSKVKVLVPGAGLGRLVFELCAAGFAVEGNELSYHALIASSLVLNHTRAVGEYTLAPFALNGSNNHSRADQFATCKVPDVHPAEALEEASKGARVHAFERMSMTAADFCVLYGSKETKKKFRAVATVFFIDTAPNVIRYVEAVRNCLVKGGIWINIGPLLWHHADRPRGSDNHDEAPGKAQEKDAGIGEPGAVELTDEEVVKLVEHFGFVVEKHEVRTIETGYIQNPKSMLLSVYRPSFWIARKR